LSIERSRAGYGLDDVRLGAYVVEVDVIYALSAHLAHLAR